MAKEIDNKTGDAENVASLKEKLAAAEARAAAAESVIARGAAVALTADDAALIEAKVAVGLTREQAVEVVKAQKAHDARLAKSKN